MQLVATTYTWFTNMFRTVLSVSIFTILCLKVNKTFIPYFMDIPLQVHLVYVYTSVKSDFYLYTSDMRSLAEMRLP